MGTRTAIAAAAVLSLCSFAQAADPPAFPVTVTVDAAHPAAAAAPVWRFFGYDEANFSYMPDGRQLLGELGQLATPADPVYVRCHHLLTSGDAVPALKWSSTNAYTEDAAGKPVYDWTVVDRIFDAYKAAGVKPYVEVGFMPEAMSTHPQDYPRDPPREVPGKVDAGMAYPPKDYGKWGELVYQWAKHCGERYGAAEAASWYWECWNEPNIAYWKGKRADYFKLYDHTAAAVRRALPTARVGGPETAGGPGGTFLRDFLRHCDDGPNAVTGGTGAPLDFVSFHAKGRPSVVDGHVRMGVKFQLADMDGGFAAVAASGKFKSLPIVIGESDPEGCAACRGPQNAYRNGTMYSSYTAATFPRAVELAERHGVNLAGVLTWAFEFEDEPSFAGFRVLSTNGVDLPVLNVFRLWHRMAGQRLPVTSTAARPVDEMLKDGVPNDRPDVSAVASLGDGSVAVMAWHYADDDLPGPPADVAVHLGGLPWADGDAACDVRRIDADHANAYAAWLAIGSPPHPSADQRAALQRASRLDPSEPTTAAVRDHAVTLHLSLPRQGVALLTVRHPAGR